MTKDELILRQQELEILNQQQEDRLNKTIEEFKKVSKQIENINKPTINNKVIDDMYNVISRVFEDFDINDHNPEYSFCIDYDNRISVEGVDLCDLDQFADQVHDAILGLFNVVDDE